MFWSANYMSVRQLNFLLKEENVTLTQILEADDILQECKADNKDLIRFLTKPEILKELIILITEEPCKDVELTTQYRHSNIACEVLTSQLSGLMSSLCINVELMNRLCDFLNQDPPLNPLLASYFSRTIETLLKRSPMQDCYLHHILCLRALDFFKAQKNFLPNLLKHIATSAIADTIKYFIFYLEEPFSEIIKEWLDKHEFLENLIQIICCDYEPDEIQATPEPVPIEQTTESDVEKGLHEESEKAEASHMDSDSCSEPNKKSLNQSGSGISERTRRLRVAASASASALACGLADGWSEEDWPASRMTRLLSVRLRTKPLLNALLVGCFCSPPEFHDTALLNACRLLRVLIQDKYCLRERTLAAHVPLLHQALLREPAMGQSGRRRVGAARLQVTALVAELMKTREPNVHMVLRTMATPEVLIKMFFAFPDNNFLHAQVCAMLHIISENKAQAPIYWKQLVQDGNLLPRLMDTFEENEDKKTPRRSSVMGHVTVACRTLAAADVGSFASDEVRERWEAFLQTRLQPMLTQLDAPLGGEYPSETSYEVGNTENVCADTYVLEAGKEDVTQTDTDNYGDDMWEDNPNNILDFDEAMQLAVDSPWERCSGWGDEEKNDGEGAAQLPEDEGWAQFNSESCLLPVDPFAPQDSPWSQNIAETGEKCSNMSELQAELNQLQLDGAEELTHNLLSALSGLAPHHLAELADTASQLPTDLPLTDSLTSENSTHADTASYNIPDATPEPKGDSNVIESSEVHPSVSNEVAEVASQDDQPVVDPSDEVAKSDGKISHEAKKSDAKMLVTDVSNEVAKSDIEMSNEKEILATDVSNVAAKSDTEMSNEVGKLVTDTREIGKPDTEMLNEVVTEVSIETGKPGTDVFSENKPAASTASGVDDSKACGEVDSPDPGSTLTSTQR